MCIAGAIVAIYSTTLQQSVAAETILKQESGKYIRSYVYRIIANIISGNES